MISFLQEPVSFTGQGSSPQECTLPLILFAESDLPSLKTILIAGKGSSLLNAVVGPGLPDFVFEPF